MSTIATGGAEPTAIGANDQDLAPGTEVGEYRIGKRIGKGGFGVVYHAEHPVIGKQVAIKILASSFASDPVIVRRFTDEARAVNRIAHPNIVDVFGFGELGNGQPYCVMELLNGRTLSLELATKGALEPARAIAILRAISSALW